MVIELVIALFIGIIAGTFTGLAPGIHINLIASLLLGSLGVFSGIPTIALVVFIVSMSITHTFLDFIPSIYLGAPEEDTFLSILPGHELSIQGRGHEAVVLTLYGSIFSLIIILIFTPIFVLYLPIVYPSIKIIIPFILILLSIYIILRDDFPFQAAMIFLLSSILGVLSFNLVIKDPLMPMLTGLFGLSNLIISVKQHTKLTKQIVLPLNKIKLSKREFFKSSLAAFISAPLCSILPGIGSGHAATIGSEIIPQERRGFLFLNGAINMVIMSLSFITLYAIGKSRSGSAAAISSLLKNISLNEVILIICVIILTSAISFIMGVQFSKIFTRYLNKINYQKLNIAVIALLIIINIIFSNWIGLIILITATAIGVYALLSNSKRINLMGCLITPSIIYYLT